MKINIVIVIMKSTTPNWENKGRKELENKEEMTQTMIQEQEREETDQPIVREISTIYILENKGRKELKNKEEMTQTMKQEQEREETDQPIVR